MHLTNLRIFGASLSVVVLSLACSHKHIVTSSENQVSKNELITMQADWFKSKGVAYDLQIDVTNISKGNIVFKLDNMQCFRGDRQGLLKYTFFNTGKKTIGFTPGQLRQFRVRCTFGEKVEGTPRVVVNQIFKNPNRDDMTLGKVLGENIEWKLGSSGN